LGIARIAFAGILCFSTPSVAGEVHKSASHLSSQRTITDTSFDWPTLEQWLRALCLRDYNTRVVVIGTSLLGAAAGVIGTFAYLRKRAMLGDALSHATLPGIALAFMLAQEKDLGWLLLGATVTGVLGVLAVMGMRYIPRIKEDAAIGIVLSVFFGAGMVLMSIIQQMGTGEEAGLQSFIYGKAAAMVRRDAVLIGGTAALVILGSVVMFKEFRAVCFDKAYVASLGHRVFLIDLCMMALVVLTTVVGLQAVGLILVVALLIIPAAAARFWTDRLLTMTTLAAVFGAVSGWLGATLSALAPRLPTGAVIVITAGALFTVSMFLSPHRGIVATGLRRWSLARRVASQHLLRAMAEHEETGGSGARVPFEAMLRERSWSRAQLRRLVRRVARIGWVDLDLSNQLFLTEPGRQAARRVLRNHRLWEMYLIKYADIAPSHVDRDADEIEHVLSETIVREIERAVAARAAIPASPHGEGAGM